MKLKFSSGNYEDLKQRLLALISESDWKEVNSNSYQAKMANGVVVNFYSSTGTVFLQGKQELIPETEEIIKKLLSEEVVSKSEIDTVTSKISTPKEEEVDHTFLSSEFLDTEIVIGLVGAVGVEYKQVITILAERLERY